MARFKDRLDREWQLAITHGDVLAIKKSTSVAIYGLFKDRLKGLADLLEDQEKTVAVVWCLIEDQANHTGVTPEAFGKSLDGESLERMQEALIEAIGDFFPSRRQALQRVNEAGRRLGERVQAKAMKALDQLDLEQEAERQMAREVAGMKGKF
jgi:hypothetical protein